MPIMIELPWPPTVNTYFTVARGRKILSSKGRKYKKDIVARFSSKSPLTGRLKVELLAYPPDKRKRDLDNLVKAVLDALDESNIFEDDSQIDDLRIIRKEKVKDGCLLACIEEIEQ